MILCLAEISVVPHNLRPVFFHYFQLIFATVLAVGYATEEAATKAATVVIPSPYAYGYPGYLAGSPINYAHAPYYHQGLTYSLPQTYAPAYTFSAAPVVAPVPAPVSSQFAAQVSLSKNGIIN